MTTTTFTDSMYTAPGREVIVVYSRPRDYYDKCLGHREYKATIVRFARAHILVAN